MALLMNGPVSERYDDPLYIFRKISGAGESNQNCNNFYNKIEFQ